MEISLNKTDLSEAFDRLMGAMNDTHDSKIVWPMSWPSKLNLTVPSEAIAVRVKDDDSVSLLMSVGSEAPDSDFVVINCQGTVDSTDFSCSPSYFDAVTRHLSSAFAALLRDLGVVTDEKLSSLRLISYN